jgi:hypothetical protein
LAACTRGAPAASAVAAPITGSSRVHAIGISSSRIAATVCLSPTSATTASPR